MEKIAPFSGFSRRVVVLFHLRLAGRKGRRSCMELVDGGIGSSLTCGENRILGLYNILILKVFLGVGGSFSLVFGREEGKEVLHGIG
jgi:hypothetical protein